MREFCISHRLALVAAATLVSVGVFAQQPEKKPASQTPTARLANAKTVLVTRARGNKIPYEVISTSIEGWGRLTLVENQEKADILVTVATTGGDSNVRVSGSSGASPLTGRPEQSTTTSRDFSNAEITLTVYDAKSKQVLWVATDTAKSALKQTTRENNMVEAAERLASKLHDRLEPPLPINAGNSKD